MKKKRTKAAQSKAVPSETAPSSEPSVAPSEPPTEPPAAPNVPPGTPDEPSTAQAATSLGHKAHAVDRSGWESCPNYSVWKDAPSASSAKKRNKMTVLCSDGETRTGRVVYVHPNKIFATLEFRGKVGTWRESIMLRRRWLEAHMPKRDCQPGPEDQKKAVPA